VVTVEAADGMLTRKKFSDPVRGTQVPRAMDISALAFWAKKIVTARLASHKQVALKSKASRCRDLAEPASDYDAGD
jgi:hypothetical protein